MNCGNFGDGSGAEISHDILIYKQKPPFNMFFESVRIFCQVISLD